MKDRGYIYLRREGSRKFELKISDEAPPATEEIECCVNVPDSHAVYKSLETEMCKKFEPVKGSNVFEGDAEELRKHLISTLQELKEAELKRKSEEELVRIINWILEP